MSGNLATADKGGADEAGAASGAGERQPGGLLHGIGAYFLWGLLPIYFKLLGNVDPLEIVASRVVWSLLLLAAILAIRGGLRDFGLLLRTPRAMAAMTASACLIAVNWLIYVWAVHHGHVVAASLGYFLNPLVNVLLGRLVLKERLRRMQMAAVALACVGVVILASAALDTLWISLMLATSFAFYGLIRKMAPVGPMQGLAAETLVLAPVALGYMGWLAASGAMMFGAGMGTSLLLASSGVVTSIPLLMFATAARRMPYSMLGLLQYIAPTMQFLLGLFYGEPLSGWQIASFGLIWGGLAIFTADSLHMAHANRRATATR